MLNVLIWAVIAVCVYIAISDVTRYRKNKRKQRSKDKELKIAIRKIKRNEEIKQEFKRNYNIQL